MTGQQTRPPQVERMDALVRRVLAPNPSPMTHHGTNSYVIGHGGEVAVLDPGPDDAGHLRAIVSALAPGERITGIIVSHAHVDHSAGARSLARMTGAPVLAWGDARAGRPSLPPGVAEIGGGEGVDRDFAPDRVLGDGEVLSGDGWHLRAIWTPGHFGNHICLDMGDWLFTGDLVMGWASSMVSPPDGDIGQFMASLDRLDGLGPRRLLPGHGDPVEDGTARIAWLRAHRLEREAQIRAALAEAPATIAKLTDRLYAEVPRALHGAARRNVLAHLIDLHRRSLVAADGPDFLTARFHLERPRQEG